MQNSAIVAARGLIMLSCLVAVPVIAVVWNDFPADWQTLRSRAIDLLDRPWRKTEPMASGDASPPRRPPERAPAAASVALPAPAENVAATERPAQAAARTQAGSVRTSAGPDVASPTPAAGPLPLANGRSISNWSRQMHAERHLAVPGQRSDAPQSHFEPAGPLVPIRSVPPAGRATDVAPVSHVEPGQGTPHDRPEGRSAAPPTIETQLARLRQLGASYYLLETWGGDGRLFRFHSKMSTGPGRATRHFEATDSDPLSAIRQVVRQVESWRFSNSQ